MRGACPCHQDTSGGIYPTASTTSSSSSTAGPGSLEETGEEEVFLKYNESYHTITRHFHSERLGRLAHTFLSNNFEYCMRTGSLEETGEEEVFLKYNESYHTITRHFHSERLRRLALPPPKTPHALISVQCSLFPMQDKVTTGFSGRTLKYPLLGSLYLCYNADICSLLTLATSSRVSQRF